MNLIRAALRKPITVVVLVAGLFFFGINAVRKIKIDIFPNIDLPVIYLSHPYGGLTPDQMESYFGKNYVNLLLYVSGLKSMETKNIQGLTLMKLTFYEGTNMAQAAGGMKQRERRQRAIRKAGAVDRARSHLRRTMGRARTHRSSYPAAQRAAHRRPPQPRSPRRRRSLASAPPDAGR